MVKPPRGRIGALTILYLPFAILEIIAIMYSSTSGELNLAGWIAGLLGMFVCFPWFLLGIGIMDYFNLHMDDYFNLVFIISIILNFILFILYDGARFQKQQMRMKRDD
jgi:hypothetical protein